MDTQCSQFHCHYKVEDRMELFRTTLVIRAFTKVLKVKDSYQSLQRTAIISCQQMFTKTPSTKLTVMSICTTYGQDITLRWGKYKTFQKMNWTVYYQTVTDVSWYVGKMLNLANLHSTMHSWFWRILRVCLLLNYFFKKSVKSLR